MENVQDIICWFHVNTMYSKYKPANIENVEYVAHTVGAMIF
jgi:hypothetical protein